MIKYSKFYFFILILFILLLLLKKYHLFIFEYFYIILQTKMNIYHILNIGIALFFQILLKF